MSNETERKYLQELLSLIYKKLPKTNKEELMTQREKNWYKVRICNTQKRNNK